MIMNNYQKRLNTFKTLCESGKTINEICNLMNITSRTLNNYEDVLGIKCKRIIRQPNLNKDFFKVIDNEVKAYILGFIYADGYIESNNRTLSFNINERDIDILHKIKYHIECGNPIRKSSTKNCVRLHLSSVELVNDLIKLGVTRHKTNTISLPNLRDDLLRHFLRGYFDGDGHIGNRQSVLVIGSETMFNDFINVIYEKFNKVLYYQKINNYYRVQLNRRDYDVICWMYNNPTIYLDRKYKSFQDNWMNYKPKG